MDVNASNMVHDATATAAAMTMYDRGAFMLT
jgi:hypothetical protein